MTHTSVEPYTRHEMEIKNYLDLMRKNSAKYLSEVSRLEDKLANLHDGLKKEVDWSGAPSWAKYVAMDRYDGWRWFSKKPPEVCPVTDCRWNDCFNQSEPFIAKPFIGNWADSLQERISNHDQ